MMQEHVPPSDEFKKVDLHIHTPGSSCYRDHMTSEAGLRTSPEEIVEAALAAELEMIAITDHNSVEGIDSIREVAGPNGPCVFPGLELSAQGGHVLVLFDHDTPVEELRALLRFIGFTKEQHGKGFLQTDVWIDEVFCLAEQSGGLAIAAHIDRRQGGFAASEHPLATRKRIHNCDCLTALEITMPRDRFRWSQGRTPHYPKRFACIQGSDAHAPEEIGRRCIYLKMPQLSLHGLRLAFAQFEQRVRFPEDLSTTN
ncbi:PHP domain-containing protein [Chloroflexota bacterium]